MSMLPPPFVDLLPRLPLAARSMLHVGCGAGGLAAGYRPRNPAVRLLGIETDTALLEQAARSFNAVAAVDIESNPLPFELSDGLDCLVYDGILEHLNDPWGVIAAQSRALTRDGVIVMSLPNPGSWQVLERLLHGQPDGNKLTPAAAFAPEMVMRHLARIGLIPCDVMESQVSRPLAGAFLDAMAPALQSLGIEAEAFAKRASAARLIWRVRKEPRQRLFL
jgi:SAM-dependent methyltransferase